jgi:hypothetical protein
VLAIADEAIERRCPLLRGASPEVADIVAKVTEQMLWNSNLKQSNRGGCAFESTLSDCAGF